MLNDAWAKADVAIGSAAASAPFWLPHFDHVIHVIVGVGGVILLIFRIAMAWREWKRRR